MSKRCISFLLAFAMFFALIPSVSAETTPSTDPVEPEILAEGVCGEAVFWKLDSTGLLTIYGEGPTITNNRSTEVPWYRLDRQITSVIVETGVTTLPDYAFWFFRTLQSLEIADSVTKLGYRMCEGATSLSHVTFPKGITEIPESAFDDTAIEKLELPEGVTEIHANAFSSCEQLTEVILPQSLVWMASCSFRSCPVLEKIVIPEGATSIAVDVFNDSPNVTIHCYPNTNAHLFAKKENIPFVLLEERPGTPIYPIIVQANDGGTVTINADASPAKRFIDLEVIPDEGYHLSSMYYYLDSDQALELNFWYPSDTKIRFAMPSCAVAFDITFVMNSSPFTDVGSKEYFYYPVLWAASKNITNGISPTRFAPNQKCTRAQVVTFLWRAAGCPEPTMTEAPFVDVTPGSYYYDALLWALENNITNGTSPTTFSPAMNCTRAQVVTFLWRACGAPQVSNGSHSFRDVVRGSYYEQAVIWAKTYGITDGVSPTQFSPDSSCTRGQIVTFLYRTFG